MSLREIAKAADVDVALVSRYFGSKKGLFLATFETVDALDASDFPDHSRLVDFLVHLFISTPRGSEMPSAFTMMLMNAADPDVGPLVREGFQNKWQVAFETVLGDPSRAALLSAVLLGMSIAEKTLRLDGIAPPDSEAYEAQLRTVIDAALRFEDPGAPVGA